MKFGKVFLVSPANVATGGPEAIHQLGYKLKSLGQRVEIFYTDVCEISPVHQNYKEYDIPVALEIDDSDNNLIIVPEVIVGFLKKFSRIINAVWWLSVDNYFFSLPGFRGLLNKVLFRMRGVAPLAFFGKGLEQVTLNFMQSDYSNDFLMKRGVGNRFPLSDYLHPSFIEVGSEKFFKKDIVVYNPKKGKSFSRRLIRCAKNIEFVAIENMARDEVVDLLKSAKVYMDFGNHPGKDRLPREAAILKCCVITGTYGAAGFSADLPIDAEFKFNQSQTSLEVIVNKIQECIEDYEMKIEAFAGYRSEIASQEEVFEGEVAKFFLS